jgi:amino acid permease
MSHFFVEMIERGWQVSPTMYPFPQDWLKFSAVIPNVLLALTFQANFFPIYKGMKDSNDHRITSACLTAIVCCGSIYLVVSIYTYMLYGSDLKANFLLCIDKNQTNPLLYYGMNIGFLVSVLFAYPIIFFSARNNFIAIIKLFIAYYS